MSRLNAFLEGLKVVDLSFYLPGPMTSLFLADMGARVVKVEPPDGDPLQELGPRDREGRGAFYQAINAGKEVVRLNLKDPGDHGRFLALVRDADVLIEGFRPGVTARLGAAYSDLSAINPRLVYCSISGHGAAGPLAQTAGHDANYLAETGILSRNGENGPGFFDPPIADTSGGLFAATAILGALRERDRSGTGCHIDIGLADVVMPLQLFTLAGLGATGRSPGRRGYYLNGGNACYQAYRLGDGHHVMLGAVEEKFWRSFCEKAGHPEWSAQQWDEQAQPALTEQVARFFAGMTLAECESHFAGFDICLTPVRDLGEAVASAHIQARGLVRRQADGGLQALFPALVDGAPPGLRPSLTTAGPVPAETGQAVK